MPYLSDNDEVRVKVILEIIDKIETYLYPNNDFESFEKDIKTQDSILMNLIVIGEVTVKLTNEFKHKHSELNWGQIKSLRNIIAHNYFGVKPPQIWQILQTSIPDLKRYLTLIP